MSANDTPTTFTDETLEKWKYALENVWALKMDRNEAEALIKRYELMQDALWSIANNSCCDKCQEAALVAKAALKRQ